MSAKDKHNICILGAPGSGKTCFLAGLAYLSENTQDDTWQIKGEKGTSTHRWLSELARTIRAGDWPPSTTGTKFYDFDLIYKKRMLSLGMVDYSGDSLVEALGELDAEQTAEIGEYLKSCQTLILMLEPQLDLVDHSSVSPEAINYSADRVNALLTAVFDTALGNHLNEMDVAIVISKADTIEDHAEASAAQKMIENSLPGFYQKLKNIVGSKSIEHFFISSVGETKADPDGGLRPGTELSPQGYDEIFTWIIDRRRQKRRLKMARKLGKFTLVIALIAIIVGSLGIFYYRQKTEVLIDPTKSLEQKIEAVSQLPFLRDEDKIVLQNLTELEFSSIERELTEGTTEAQLHNALDRLTKLKTALDSSYQEKVRRLENRLIELMEKMLTDKIKRYMDEGRWEEANFNISEYFQKYPRGSLIESVESMKVLVYSELEKKDRHLVMDVTLASRSRNQWASFLADKAKAVLEYVSKRGLTGPSKVDMLKAVSLANYLASHNEYTVKIGTAQGLNKDYATWLEIWSGSQLVNNKNPQNGKNPTWNEDVFLNWTPGTNIRIKWFRKDLIYDDLIAEVNDDGIFALRKLSGKVKLTVQSNWVKEVSDPVVIFRVKGNGTESLQFEENDWILLEEYIHPGEYWQK
jgi:Cdc6-like AAA superfamily ATPase